MDVRHVWRKQQDGGDEGARVADADPPDEVDVDARATGWLIWMPTPTKRHFSIVTKSRFAA